jgi:hypothetical protein
MYNKRFLSLTALMVTALGCGLTVVAALPVNDWVSALLMIGFSLGVYKLAMGAR